MPYVHQPFLGMCWVHPASTLSTESQNTRPIQMLPGLTLTRRAGLSGHRRHVARTSQKAHHQVELAQAESVTALSAQSPFPGPRFAFWLPFPEFTVSLSSLWHSTFLPRAELSYSHQGTFLLLSKPALHLAETATLMPMYVTNWPSKSLSHKERSDQLLSSVWTQSLLLLGKNCSHSSPVHQF